MSEKKWTPGPWWVGREQSPIGATVVTDNDTPACSKCEVAYYGGNLVAESLTPANAHLIAAAPELYEALAAFERVVDLWLPADSEVDVEHYGEAEALAGLHRTMISALAKARGEQE